MKKIYLLLIFFVLINLLNSDELENILQSGEFYWGLGESPNYETAQSNATKDLSNQISVVIKSRFHEQYEEILKQSDTKQDIDLFNYTSSFVETYSSAYLKDPQRKVIEPTWKSSNYKVYTYINKLELSRIFEARRLRAEGFLQRGKSNCDRLNIHRALLDYYSGLLLISSHPDYDEIMVTTDLGKQNLKLTLEDELSKTFSKISFSISKNTQDLSNYRRFNIKAFYQNKPIQKLQFTYFNGNDMCIGNINNGIGAVDLLKTYLEPIKPVRLSVVYGKGYSAEHQLMDPELKALEGLVFSPLLANNYFLDLTAETTRKKASIKKEFVSEEKMKWGEKRDLHKMMINIVKSIRAEEIDELKQYFTRLGFTQFLNIMNHGDVTVCEEDFTLKYLNLGNQIQIRSLPITYKLASSKPKVIIERLNFIVENDSITWVNYSLDDKLVEEAIELDKITNDLSTRLMSVTFMEYYKTIFNTKQIDLISDIFSDDAKIFVGYVKRSETLDFDVTAEINNQLEGKFRVKKYRKEEYIENLTSVFKNNKYINIEFRDPEIIRRSKTKPIYALQMHQDFYSDKYSDQGYLLLFVDFSEQGEPKIFFRFWQPEKIGEEELRLISPGDICW